MLQLCSVMLGTAPRSFPWCTLGTPWLMIVSSCADNGMLINVWHGVFASCSELIGCLIFWCRPWSAGFRYLETCFAPSLHTVRAGVSIHAWCTVAWRAAWVLRLAHQHLHQFLLPWVRHACTCPSKYCYAENMMKFWLVHVFTVLGSQEEIRFISSVEGKRPFQLPGVRAGECKCCCCVVYHGCYCICTCWFFLCLWLL